jgi:hypothetical protein
MPGQTWLWRVCPFPKVGYMNCSVSMLSKLRKRVSKLSFCTILSQSARLTVYGTAARYPSDAEAVSLEEYQEALRLAAAVVIWAETTIETGQAPHA